MYSPQFTVRDHSVCAGGFCWPGFFITPPFGACHVSCIFTTISQHSSTALCLEVSIYCWSWMVILLKSLQYVILLDNNILTHTNLRLSVNGFKNKI